MTQLITKEIYGGACNSRLARLRQCPNHLLLRASPTFGRVFQDTDTVNGPSENPQPVAIDQLEALGVSGYTAETFLALASVGSGTGSRQ